MGKLSKNEVGFKFIIFGQKFKIRYYQTSLKKAATDCIAFGH